MTSYMLCFITCAVIAGATGVVSQTPVFSPSGPTFVDENAKLVLTTTYQMSSDAPLLMKWVKNNNSYFLQLLVSTCQSINPRLLTGYSITCTKTGTTYTFTLTIASITKVDEGQTWQSDITTNDGTVRSLETLSVRVRVPIVSVTLTTQTAITVLEGTQITFICDTSESNPSSTITWYKDQNTATTTDDQEITTGVTTSDVPLDSGTITQGTLRYSPSRQDNGWSVFCYASNVGPLFTSRKCALTVHYPPTITSIPDKSIVAGQSLSQTCEVLYGNPTAYTYRWTRGGSSLKQSQRTLSVPSVQTSDMATYTCRVQNTMTPTGQTQQQGEDTESFILDVLSPPTTPTFRYKNQNVSETTLSFIYNTPGDFLRCESSGNPSPNYEWQRQGASRYISTSQDLTLTTIQRDQDGVYKCIAYNTLSPSYGSGGGDKSSTTTITLNVLYPPSTPSLRHETSSGPLILSNILTVVRGDYFTVACSADSNPGPRYQWTGQSGYSQILTINNIQGDTTRTCTATNTIQATNSGTPVSQSASTTVTISVMSPPTTPTFRYKNQAVTGTTLSFIHGTRDDYLTCESTGNPPPNYRWQSQGVSRDMSKSRNLILTTIQKNEGGVYKCIAYNTLSPSYGSGGGSKSRTTTITLNVLYPPSILPISPQRVNEGRSFSIPCVTTAGNPPQTTYTWTRSGDNSWRQDARLMTRLTTSRTHAGDYTCKAQNTMVPTKPSGQQQGVDTKTVQVTVQYTPDVTVTTTNTTVNANNADIVCSPSGVPTTYTYQTWIHHWSPGVEIIHSPKLGNNPTLQLTQLSYQHSGIYTCTAGNGILASNNPGAGSGNVYLLVKSHPIITFPNIKQGSHPVTASLNADVNITIQYYTNADVTNIKLYNASIGGEEVQDFNQTTSDTNVNLTFFNKAVVTPGKILTLTMSVTDESQFGSYKLDINNVIGNGTVFINLIPESPPDAPTLKPISESGITEHTVTVSWIRGFHGGLDQTFVIQWSDDNKSWNNKSIPSDQSLSKILLTFTIESLIPSTKYYIRIFAKNEKGSSPYTGDIMTVTTLEDNSSSLGGIIGGTIAAVVVIVLVVVAVVLSLKYECKCQKKIAKPQSTEESNNQYENVTEGNIDNIQIHNASEQVSYYNIGRESEPVPSTYESLSDREPTPNMYSSLQNIEMVPIRNFASNPDVSEPIQSQYESLTDREADPNMYSSLDNTESSLGGKVALNPEQVYDNVKV